jgi:hypothetical protein
VVGIPDFAGIELGRRQDCELASQIAGSLAMFSCGKKGSGERGGVEGFIGEVSWRGG